MSTAEHADRVARNTLELVQARREIAAVRALHQQWCQFEADNLDTLAMWEALDSALAHQPAPKSSDPEEFPA